MIPALGIIARLGLAALVGFEGLNWAGMLRFTLDFSWLGLIITATAVIALLEGSAFLLKRATGRGLHPVIYFVAAASLLIDAVGDIGHFYNRFDWYDQLAHFVGGAVVGLVAFNVLWQLEGAHRIRLGAWLRGVGVVALGALAGALYEIEEYLEDAWKWHRQVRLGDGPDTANDMLLNIVGALTVAVLAAIVVGKWYGNRSRAVEPTDSGTP